MRFNDDYSLNESYTDKTDGDVVLESNIDNFYEGDGIQDMSTLMESIISDQITNNMTETERQSFLESDEFKMLEEAGAVSKRTKVRLNRNDDLTRRLHLAALQKAREEGDADWHALARNRREERRLLNKIYSKYVARVRNDVIKAQKRLIKLSPKAFDTIKMR